MSSSDESAPGKCRAELSAERGIGSDLRICRGAPESEQVLGTAENF
jgi:hypothetical protein